MKEAAVKLIPTLLKYPAMAETDQAMRQVSGAIFPEDPPPETPAVTLVRYPEDAEEQLNASVLYGYTKVPWMQVIEHVRKLSGAQREGVIDEYLKRRGPHDQPLRELEHLYYTFDILLDYGTFRDIQRHRMATQTRQDLSPTTGTALLVRSSHTACKRRSLKA